MFNLFIGLIKDHGPVALLVCVMVPASAALWIKGRWAEALKTPGRDRARLIRSLRLGGDIRRYYVFLVSRALDRVDLFLGDADRASLSISSPFGNRRKAPYWTVWSFDACALIAIVYPIAGLFVTWVCTGDSGDIGKALGLVQDAPLVPRAVNAITITLAVLAFYRGVRADMGWSLLWYGGGCALYLGGGLIGSGIVAGAFFVAIAVGMALGTSTLGNGAAASAVVLTVCIAFVCMRTYPIGGLFGFGLYLVGVCAVGIVLFAALHIIDIANRRIRLGMFWLIFWPAQRACP
jgi:hypothetical protein